MLRIKGAFPMFVVISNKTVQNPQNSNKNIKKTKRTQSSPFIKQHLRATSLNINHEILYLVSVINI